MMTNEELKKKIAKIIADYFCPQGNEHKKLWGDDRLCYSKMNFAECEWVTECANALIAAGIGDTKAAVREFAGVLRDKISREHSLGTKGYIVGFKEMKERALADVDALVKEVGDND